MTTENRDSTSIKGCCNSMCPENEIIMRQRENLVHILEANSSKKVNERLKADRNKMVKMYSRSAAGQKLQSKHHLRTPEALLKTVHYLLNDVITNTDYKWNFVYDFIVDRLKAVRQDMIIQRMARVHCISLLQPMVWFYAYSAYRLCEEPVELFDPTLNKRELMECLKMLLVFYDETEQFNDNFFRTCNIESPAKNYFTDNLSLFEECRPQFEALYVLLNLGDTVAMTRAVELPKKWRTETVLKALKVSLEFWKGNYVNVCKMMNSFKPLLSATLVLHLPEIRKKSFMVMATAYNSKQLSFPVETLRKILAFNDNFEVIHECLHYNLTLIDNKSAVQFTKTSFNYNQELLKPIKSTVLDQEIAKHYLPLLILDN